MSKNSVIGMTLIYMALWPVIQLFRGLAWVGEKLTRGFERLNRIAPNYIQFDWD